MFSWANAQLFCPTRGKYYVLSCHCRTFFFLAFLSYKNNGPKRSFPEKREKAESERHKRERGREKKKERIKQDRRASPLIIVL